MNLTHLGPHLIDGKAAYQINPHGGNLPVRKGDCVGPVLDQCNAPANSTPCAVSVSAAATDGSSSA